MPVIEVDVLKQNPNHGTMHSIIMEFLVKTNCFVWLTSAFRPEFRSYKNIHFDFPQIRCPKLNIDYNSLSSE